MNFTEYQNLARRTQNIHLDPHQRLEHALFGLAAETGEIHRIFQKVYQGHSITLADLIGEMGDLLWFTAELADVHGLTQKWSSHMIRQSCSWAYIWRKLVIRENNMHPNVHSSTIYSSQDMETT